MSARATGLLNLTLDPRMWGRGAAGSAIAWHAIGHEFESRRLHHSFSPMAKTVAPVYDPQAIEPKWRDAWDREVTTSNDDYYRWTQWLFLKFLELGLAYKQKAWVNWCPKDNTVLANEQIVNGVCWRCGTKPTKKELEQWFFKITTYAQR